MTARTYSAFVIVAALMLLMSIAGGAGCTFDSSSVSKSSVIRRLPVGPEGIWHEFEMLADAGAKDEVLGLFSRRYLNALVEPSARPPKYEKDAEDYDAQLAKLDQQLSHYRTALEQHASAWCERIANMRREGMFLTSRAVGGEDPAYRDERELPRGPNEANMTLIHWPGLPGVGEANEFRVKFVQEYEEWRIDGFEPNLLK